MYNSYAHSDNDENTNCIRSPSRQEYLELSQRKFPNQNITQYDFFNKGLKDLHQTSICMVLNASAQNGDIESIPDQDGIDNY